MHYRSSAGRSGPPMIAPFELLLGALYLFIVLALTSQPTKTLPSHIDTRGVYAVTLSWRAGSNDDIDLWVRDPTGNVAWFGGQDAGLMHLSDDDLGTNISGTQVLPDGRTVVVRENGERTVIRGSVPGEYVVNVHFYKQNDPGAMPTTVELWELRGRDRRIISRHVLLIHEKQEQTAFRFTLDRRGDVGRLNRLQTKFVRAPSPNGSTPPGIIVPGAPPSIPRRGL